MTILWDVSPTHECKVLKWSNVKAHVEEDFQPLVWVCHKQRYLWGRPEDFDDVVVLRCSSAAQHWVGGLLCRMSVALCAVRGCSWPVSACSLPCYLTCPQFSHLSTMSALAPEGGNNQQKVAHMVSPNHCKSVTQDAGCPLPVTRGLMSSIEEAAKRNYNEFSSMYSQMHRWENPLQIVLYFACCLPRDELIQFSHANMSRFLFCFSVAASISHLLLNSWSLEREEIFLFWDSKTSLKDKGQRTPEYVLSPPQC